ncbi:MAG: hypothetical protein ABUL69_03935 [Peristeroidobacter soli]
MLRLAPTLVLCLALLTGCATDLPPAEVTDDGLARVAARSIGGVYRLPEASFAPYRRVMLEPPSITFINDWRKNHPEVNNAEFMRLLQETVVLFREEFTREFVELGSYTIAEDPAPDVLLIVPAIEELNIVAPDAGDGAGQQTYTPVPVTMKITGDLRDAATSKLVGRVIMYQTDHRSFGEVHMQIANRVTNAHEQRLAYSKWSRLVREAIDVAKAEKPRPHKPKPAEAPTENEEPKP